MKSNWSHLLMNLPAQIKRHIVLSAHKAKSSSLRLCTVITLYFKMSLFIKTCWQHLLCEGILLVKGNKQGYREQYADSENVIDFIVGLLEDPKSRMTYNLIKPSTIREQRYLLYRLKVLFCRLILKERLLSAFMSNTLPFLWLLHNKSLPVFCQLNVG